MNEFRYIAVQIPGITTYARHVIRGAQRYLDEHGGPELLLNLEPALPGAIEQLRRLNECIKIEGIIAEVWNRRLLLDTVRLGIPTVEVSGTWAPDDVTSVHSDNAAVGKLVAQYLLGKGLRSFAYVGTSQALHARQRQAAFLQTIQEAGFPCSVRDWEYVTRVEISPDETSLQAWLRSLPKPVGIMAWFDYSARDIAYACRKEGLRIPDDVALVGVGNDELVCETGIPALSSVDLNPMRVGYQAIQTLMELIGGERHATGEHILVPPGSVVERSSSRGLVLANAEVASAIRYIEEHLDQPLEVRDVLKNISISRRALEGHFLRLFGRTPREHIRQLQLEQAKKLLRTTNLSIKDVALRSGFPGATVFCATFRRVEGLTPGDYREQAAGQVAPVTSSI